MVPDQTQSLGLQGQDTCTSVFSAGHRKEAVDTCTERAASRPSSCFSLFERRGRKGIAPLKMECVKPFKPRSDGKLCILDAPATHIRLGSSVGIDGNRMLTCIDIHTLEYFLMPDKDAPKHHLPMENKVVENRDEAKRERGDYGTVETSSSSHKAEVSANMKEAVGVLTNICQEDEADDDYSYTALGSLISPSSSFYSEPCSPLMLPTPTQADTQPSNSCFILDHAVSEHAPSTAPTTIPDIDMKARLGVKRTFSSSPSAAVVSPLTPCNVDAGPNLWTLRSAPITFETAVVDSVRSEIEQEVVLKRRRL
jgi:hypothetical protein